MKHFSPNEEKTFSVRLDGPVSEQTQERLPWHAIELVKLQELLQVEKKLLDALAKGV